MFKYVAVALVLAVSSFNAFADDDDDDRVTVCSRATLNGNYGFAMDGTMQPVGPVALAGIIRANGAGAFSGVEVASIGGQIVQATYTGSYTVNPDCTGQAQYQLVAPNFVATRSMAFVITNGGKEFFMMSTVPGSVISGKAQRL